MYIRLCETVYVYIVRNNHIAANLTEDLSSSSWVFFASAARKMGPTSQRPKGTLSGADQLHIVQLSLDLRATMWECNTRMG